MRQEVLKIPIDFLSGDVTLEILSGWMRGTHAMKQVITVYSEFVVRAQKDRDFFEILKQSDLNTPDGVSLLAARRFLERARGKSLPIQILIGVRVGFEILAGRIGKPVTGVWLFEELIKLAAKEKKKVFLLGGWNKVSGRVATMLLKRFPELKIDSHEGEKMVGTDKEMNKMVMEKINNFSPDVLFVSYNPVKQEKWLARHRDKLKVKIGMGVGGTFNEYLGEFKKAPGWMERSGLKWFWRVLVEPRRLGRIAKAVFVFPWLVFRSIR